MTCAICGSGFTPTNKLNLYCSKTCKNQAAHQARMARGNNAAQVKARRAAGQGMFTIVCETCGKTTFSQRESGRFCDQACNALAKINAGRFRHPKACDQCGTLYLPWGKRQRYCSRGCAATVQREKAGEWRREHPRSRKFKPGKARRLALYERDGWVCQICFEQVDVGLHYLDDWAPSLDHIVCRTNGGTDDDDNLRLAHRWCNSVRSDDTRWTAADLAA